MSRDRCERCGRALRDEGKVMLDLNMLSHLYTLGEWPPEESQGGFWFGRACAERELLKTYSCGHHIGAGVRIERHKDGRLKRVHLP